PVIINAATCNFENNGGGDRELWQRMHERLRSLELHLLFRQEMWGADANDGELASAADAMLGMSSLIGQRCCTAVYHDPAVFTPVREWPRTGPMWVLPPTIRTMHLTGTPQDAAALVVGPYHLNYASTTTRLAEAEWLTTWNDKWERRGPRLVKAAALLGGDNNSFPTRGADGDPALPVLEAIEDRPHRAHRSYQGPDDVRLMDDRPDETLRTAGLEDVARHLALSQGIGSALAPTVDAGQLHWRNNARSGCPDRPHLRQRGTAAGCRRSGGRGHEGAVGSPHGAATPRRRRARRDPDEPADPTGRLTIRQTIAWQSPDWVSAHRRVNSHKAFHGGSVARTATHPKFEHKVEGSPHVGRNGTRAAVVSPSSVRCERARTPRQLLLSDMHEIRTRRPPGVRVCDQEGGQRART
ncbi:MAG: hypothetical protein JO362_14020, partial [Streptomycetaceae bacterium]|nr:hypothetical protein [Streptomycetaceae bacterium]